MSCFLLLVLIAHSLYFVSEHDISLILLFVLELFHLTSMQPMSFTLLSKLLTPVISFLCMAILLFFYLLARILLFDSDICHYSSVLIAHTFNFILCMKILLFYFLPTRNFSYDFHACHVPYFSFLIVGSFYSISVHHDSITILSSSLRSFILFPCMSCLNYP
jgi:hypothetical protein